MADVTAETIDSRHDGFQLTAARARPAGKRKGGVVVIQEIFGVSPHIKEICSFFADNGYEALAPSLYDRIEKPFDSGPPPEGMAKGVQGATTTPLPQVIADIQSTIDALGPGPIYITGFCYGGAMSWLAAQKCTGLTAASGFYGGMITRLLDEKPKIPIILHYGAKDAHIPDSEIQKVRDFASDVPVYVYDAGHGFCRRNSADFDQASCDLGLKRTLDFFAANS